MGTLGREEALGWTPPPAPGGGGESRSAWFRQYSFWGWHSVPDYATLVSLPSRLARGRGPAAEARLSAWRRSSMQPLWRAATKRMARHERIGSLARRPLPPLLHLLRAHARAPRRRAARAGRVGSVTRYRHRRALGPGTASTWTARRSKLSSVPCWTQRCRAAAPSACGPRRYWSRPPVRPPRALRPSRSCCAPRRVCPAAPHSCSLAWLTGRERAQVEVIVHMYVHAGAIAGDAVTAMLRELVLASEPHLRVTALEIVVNAALRTQLLLDWCQTPESEEPEQSEHHELVEGANKDLRSQLLRLTALAFHEELLDAQMSDVAISGVLLLCTDDGNFDQMLRTHLPLEVLAALVSHRYSSLCASPVVGE